MKTPAALACLAFIALPSAGLTQAVQCHQGDASCLSSLAVYDAVTEAHNNDGMLAWTVGIFCGDSGLQADGQRKYAATLPTVIQSARAKLAQSIPNTTVAAPYLQTIDQQVRAARSAEAAGAVAGLNSAFAMYPQSKLEYCSRMKASLSTG